VDSMNTAEYKLIVEFMGLKPTLVNPDCYSLSKQPWLSVTGSTPEKVIQDFCKSTSYHSSWDWLMPVVEKIETLKINEYTSFVVNIRKNGCGVDTFYDEDLDDGGTKEVILKKWIWCQSTNKLQATFETVVTFIKWYKQTVANMNKDNKLIAEFMGVEYTDFRHDDYDTSWGWLMPVAEKIQDMRDYMVRITKCHCDILKLRSNKTIVMEHGESTQKAVYKAVVEFIKWYNKNKGA